jgi:hypothetical protein
VPTVVAPRLETLLRLRGTASAPLQHIVSGADVRTLDLALAEQRRIRVGIMVSYTQGSVIGYNELTDMPYSGVSVGWGWADVDNVARDNVVRYNRVWNVLHTEAAGGGLYTLSRQARTLLAENYIFDIVRLGLRDQRDLPGRGEQSHHGAGQRLREHRRCGSSSQCARSRQRVFLDATVPPAAVVANSGLEPEYQDIRP